jgi:hypothetical protein
MIPVLIEFTIYWEMKIYQCGLPPISLNNKSILYLQNYKINKWNNRITTARNYLESLLAWLWQNNLKKCGNVDLEIIKLHRSIFFYYCYFLLIGNDYLQSVIKKMYYVSCVKQKIYCNYASSFQYHIFGTHKSHWEFYVI